MSEPVSNGFRADWLSPPAYQREVVALLKQLEPEAWRMVSAAPETRRAGPASIRDRPRA